MNKLKKKSTDYDIEQKREGRKASEHYKRRVTFTKKIKINRGNKKKKEQHLTYLKIFWTTH